MKSHPKMDYFSTVLNKLEVEVVGEWKPQPDGRMFIKVVPTNIADWQIYGTMTLVRRVDGTFGYLDQPYHFNMHETRMPLTNWLKETFRNFTTKVGEPAGGGVPFNISFDGTSANLRLIKNWKDFKSPGGG